MTLQQAFTQWAVAPRNTVLAAKSRGAVQLVLMRRWGGIDLENISETFARRIFRESNETLELQVKAASILVYVLSWGGDHGYCRRPAFTYEIASQEWKARQQENNDEKEPQEDKDSCEPETNQQPEQMEEKKQNGTQPRPVVQIAPDTLQVVKEWPSMAQAKNELGVNNIDRAIKRHSLAGGFYWCNHGEQDGFEPRKKSAGGRPANPKQDAEREQEHKTLVQRVNEAHYRSLERMEQHSKEKELQTTKGPMTGGETSEEPDLRQELIRDLTDKELLKELELRGWQGELQCTQIVSIGQEF